MADHAKQQQASIAAKPAVNAAGVKIWNKVTRDSKVNWAVRFNTLVVF